MHYGSCSSSSESLALLPDRTSIPRTVQVALAGVGDGGVGDDTVSGPDRSLENFYWRGGWKDESYRISGHNSAGLLALRRFIRLDRRQRLYVAPRKCVPDIVFQRITIWQVLE